MSLDMTIEKLPEGTAVATLSGAMTLGTSLKMVDAQVHSALSDGVTNLVLDLTAVPYSDSAGLGLLMYTYGLVKEKGGTLRLCGVSARVLSMLQMTRTDTFLPMDANREASLAALRQ